MLTTYPLKHAVHGGQRRSLALKQAYESAGFVVTSCAVYNATPYSLADKGPYDMPAPELTQHKINETPIFEDVILGTYTYEDPTIRHHVARLIRKLNPRLIVIEQAYLYIGVRKILRDLDMKIDIINSSHNIESDMKQAIYAQYQPSIPTQDIKKTVTQVRELERTIAKEAALTIAVSESDASKHRKMGAKNVLVIPNGINANKPKPEYVRKWQEYLSKRGIDRVILFTGSAHPPNSKGFLKMVGSRLGFLPINARIMIIGDVGRTLEGEIYQTNPRYGHTFWLRAQNCGRLSDDDLAALIHLSHVIILPITEGGGSNLKTAEAIASGKRIVATKHAMRGYDEYIDRPLLSVSNSPKMFRENLLKAVMYDNVPLSKSAIKSNNQVLWTVRTKPLVEMMEKYNA